MVQAKREFGNLDRVSDWKPFRNAGWDNNRLAWSKNPAAARPIKRTRQAGFKALTRMLARLLALHPSPNKKHPRLFASNGHERLCHLVGTCRIERASPPCVVSVVVSKPRIRHFAYICNYAASRNGQNWSSVTYLRRKIEQCCWSVFIYEILIPLLMVRGATDLFFGIKTSSMGGRLSRGFRSLFLSSK